MYNNNNKYQTIHHATHVGLSGGPGAVVKAAWKVGGRGLEPRSGIQVSKLQNVSSPLTRNDSTLWGAFVTER